MSKRHWLRQADADVGRGQPGDLTTDEREELRRLRRENQVLRQEREILKSRSLLRAGDLVSRYRFIHEEQARAPLVLLCRVLHVARSAYYVWVRRGATARARADQALTEQIASVHARSRRTYGAPRIHAALRAQGTRCARKRVARLMRAAGLVGCHRRRRTRTTVADPAHTPAPNLVARDFTAPARDRLWIGDITYVATAEGWLYLAVLVDVYPGVSSGGRWPSICARS